MREKRLRMPVAALVTAAFSIAGLLRPAVADEPIHAAGQDFLAKATIAIKAVQERAKDDKILGPLTKAKIEQGGGDLTIDTETPESWPNFPAKPHNLDRGHGWLRIDAIADLPEPLPVTPFGPPPGCYWGSTYLIVPNTHAKILIDTTTSDPGAQRRLVDMTIKELSNAGITARPADPEKVDSFPRPQSAPDAASSRK